MIKQIAQTTPNTAFVIMRGREGGREAKRRRERDRERQRDRRRDGDEK
jgi:hypothetical protein